MAIPTGRTTTPEAALDAPGAQLFRVALTGNIASGKSAVADVWAGLGVPIIDADVLAREAVAPGMPGLRQVADLFGASVIRSDGTLDRTAVRDIVFGDALRRRALEQVLHPEISRLREAEEARLLAAGESIVVHVIPLLFETGLERLADAIVFVDAPESVRLDRLVRTRGLSEKEARAMIDAQMPADRKRGRADVVIDNTNSLVALEERALDAWRDIRTRATARHGAP
jgi:dephospho-CoA kinase